MSYHAEAKRLQALSRQQRVKARGHVAIPRRRSSDDPSDAPVGGVDPSLRRKTILGSVPEVPNKGEKNCIDAEGGTGKQSHSAGPWLGGFSLLKMIPSRHRNDSGKTAETSIESSDVGAIAPEPEVKNESQTGVGVKRLLSSSCRMRQSMSKKILGSRNSTVPQIRANILEHSVSERNEVDSLSTVILKSLSNMCLCDVEIVGMDEVLMGAPGYLLAAHSDVFLAILYSDSTDAGENDNLRFNQHKIEIPFAGRDAIEGTMHFLATRSLPCERENETSEFNIRCLSQIHLLGRVFKIASLTNHAYRTACRLMNKTPCLVCACFDECIESTKLLPPNLTPSSMHDELKDFVLDFLRNSPLSTLMGGGIAFLGRGSIEGVISDQEMDVDELTMFSILNTWVKHDKGRIETGKLLVLNIRLAYIKPDYLNNVVRKCGFVESSAVDVALREIDKMLANDSPDKKEHVLVEGAGDHGINGIYVRTEEDIGLGSDEVMFVKEAGEGEYIQDYGLYRRRSTWAITSCSDHSNILYSCEVPDGDPSALYRAPNSGWEAADGGPAPTCTWNPSKENLKTAAGGYVAPNLVGTREKSIEDINRGDHDDGVSRRYSLHTMLMLPSDEGHDKLDYHDDLDASCKSWAASTLSGKP